MGMNKETVWKGTDCPWRLRECYNMECALSAGDTVAMALKNICTSWVIADVFVVVAIIRLKLNTIC